MSSAENIAPGLLFYKLLFYKLYKQGNVIGFLYGLFPGSGSDADIDSKSYCKGGSDMTRGHLKNPFQFPQDAVMPDRMRN